jgi:hypothetical protein
MWDSLTVQSGFAAQLPTRSDFWGFKGIDRFKKTLKQAIKNHPKAQAT